MNNFNKFVVSLLFVMTSTSASAITNAQLFAWAAATYPSYFTGTPSSGQYQQYSYQLFASGNYLAIDTNGSVYVLGPVSGNQLLNVGTLTSFDSLVSTWQTAQSSGGTSTTSQAACGSAPAGMTYAESGNTLSVTTNGCIALPTAGMCAPSASQATGLNVLITSSLASMNMSGITFNIPGMTTNPLDSVGSALVAGTTCIQNAPQNLSSMTINYDVCYDITSQMSSSLTAAAGYITATPPITMTAKGSSTMQSVADCTTSGATTISDALTGKVKTKQANGTYLQVN